MKKDMEINKPKGMEMSLFRRMPLPICPSAGIGKAKVNHLEKWRHLRFPSEYHKGSQMS